MPNVTLQQSARKVFGISRLCRGGRWLNFGVSCTISGRVTGEMFNNPDAVMSLVPDYFSVRGFVRFLYRAPMTVEMKHANASIRALGAISNKEVSSGHFECLVFIRN